MASQGILFMSFLVYGLLLDVSKGQNIVNGDKVSDASLLQTLAQSTIEPRLEVFEPETSSTGVIINQSIYGQEIQNDTLKSGKGKKRILIKQRVTNLQANENRAKPQNKLVIRAHALAMKGKDSKGQVQLYSLIRETNEINLRKARKSRKRGEHIGYVVTDGERVDRNYMPVDETQNQTREPHLLVFEKINITDDSEENEPVTNSQLQTQTTEAPTGVFNGINTTDVPEELEPVTNIQPQNQTITEPQIGIFDRMNTTDVPEKLQPVTNYTGTVINEPVQGQEMYNDILTQGHTTTKRDKVSDVSLLQTLIWTTIEPHLEVFDSANATDVPKEFELETNFTGLNIYQPVSGQDIPNDTLKSENGNMSRLVKEGVSKVQASESRGKAHNTIVMRARALAMKGKDSKGQVKLYSRIGNNEGKEMIKSRNSRKGGEHKVSDKERGKKLKQYR